MRSEQVIVLQFPPAPLCGSLSAYTYNDRSGSCHLKKPPVRFVTPGCHACMSLLVVAPPCRFDREMRIRENLWGDRAVVLRGPGEMTEARPVSAGIRAPLNRHRSLTIELRVALLRRRLLGHSRPDAKAPGREAPTSPAVVVHSTLNIENSTRSLEPLTPP